MLACSNLTGLKNTKYRTMPYSGNLMVWKITECGKQSFKGQMIFSESVLASKEDLAGVLKLLVESHCKHLESSGAPFMACHIVFCPKGGDIELTTSLFFPLTLKYQQNWDNEGPQPPETNVLVCEQVTVILYYNYCSIEQMNLKTSSQPNELLSSQQVPKYFKFTSQINKFLFNSRETFLEYTSACTSSEEMMESAAGCGATRNCTKAQIVVQCVVTTTTAQPHWAKSWQYTLRRSIAVTSA